MRYYLITIQFNREAGAENRTVPRAFDTRDDAEQAFHEQVAKDMKNDTLGWSLNVVINDTGYAELTKKWVRPIQTEVATEE